MNKRIRAAFQQLERAGVAREVSRANIMWSTGEPLHASRPLPVWKRAFVGVLALLLWLMPLSVTFEQSRNAAGVLNAGNRSWTDEAWEALRAAAAMRLRLALQVAQAGPIVDPTAPIVFRPTVTQTTGAGGGVPVVNITAPNAAGISLNQYQRFDIDPVGLILNNSLYSGTSLTGGQVAANPNLGNRVRLHAQCRRRFHVVDSGAVAGQHIYRLPLDQSALRDITSGHDGGALRHGDGAGAIQVAPGEDLASGLAVQLAVNGCVATTRNMDVLHGNGLASQGNVRAALDTKRTLARNGACIGEVTNRSCQRGVTC
jgi:hypothetical protein